MVSKQDLRNEIEELIELINKENDNLETLFRLNPENPEHGELLEELRERYYELRQLNSGMEKDLEKLLDHLDKDNLFESIKFLEKIEKRRENYSKRIYEEFRNIDFSELQYENLEQEEDAFSVGIYEGDINWEKIGKEMQNVFKIEEKIEKIDKHLIHEFKSLVVEKEFEKRPKVIIREKGLKKYLKQVEKATVENGNETGGVFRYKTVESGIELIEYLKLPVNTSETPDNKWVPSEEVNKMLKEKSSEEKLLIAHSHPYDGVSSYSLSAVDIEYFFEETKTGIGILATPSENGETLWVMAQTLKKSTDQVRRNYDASGARQHYDKTTIRNLLIKVVRDGKDVTRNYGQIEAYNKAIKESVRLGRNPKKWFRIYEERIK